MTEVTLDLEYKKNKLHEQNCFKELTEEEAFILAGLLKEERYSKGDVIVTQGDPVDKVFIIIEGEADVELNTVENHHLHTEIVATLGKDQAIGLNDSGFYSLSGRRTATVIAKNNMLLLALSVAAFHGFALAYPHVNEKMRKTAASFLGKIES